ncbi:MAG: type IV pilus secretin PilQ [Steroidobacteraceae bacterium]
MKAFPRNPRVVDAAALSLLALLALTAARPARSAEAQVALQSIQVQSLPHAQMQLALHLSGPAPKPLSFTMDHPARVVIDLPDTQLAMPSNQIRVKSGGLESVIAAATRHRARVVLNLDSMVAYALQRHGDEILVTLGAGAAHEGDADAAAASTADASTAAVGTGLSTPWEIRHISFRRSTDGAGRILVRLSNPHIPVNLRQVGNQVVIDFSHAAVPANLLRRFDATDFGTPVRDFSVTNTPRGSRMTIDATGAFTELAYQANTQYVVELRPLTQGQVAAQRPKYTGQRLSLNFQSIKVRAVLQLLADASGQNIVVANSVHGTVTLRLHDVPWDQALHLILQIEGLGERHQGNVILVAPQAELAAREKAELAAEQAVQQLEPLRSEYIQINYAKAANLAALIKSQGHSLLSKRGSVTVDKRTNTLLVQDTPERLVQIQRMVRRLDVPVRQVLISARIVLVNNDFQRQLGTRLGLTDVQANGANGIVATTGNAAGTDIMTSSAISNLQGTNTPYPVTFPSGQNAADRYDVNLPVSNPAGSIAFGILSGNYLVDLELSAAQAETEAKVISSPRVITANQRQATILQGTEIPYQQSASSGATSIAFKRAVLELKVTPQITPDNRIILTLEVRDDEIGQEVVASGGVQVPAIDTRQVTTQVLVNDGQTVVLGGILQTNNTHTINKVPWLGDLPIIGHLFKNTDHTNNKDELLVFVTPKIIHQNPAVY